MTDADPRSVLDQRGFGTGFNELHYLMFMLPIVLDARVIVETGLGGGDSTRLHLAALSEMYNPETRELHTWENNGHQWGDVEREVRKLGLPPKWTVHREDSTRLRDATDSLHFSLHPIDYLFLDSDHAYLTVTRELEAFTPFLSDRAVIATHDAWPATECAHASFIDVRSDKGRPSTTYWAFKDWRAKTPGWKLTLLAYPEGLAILTRERGAEGP